MNINKPIHHAIDRINRCNHGQRRTGHHDNGNTEITRRRELGRRRRAVRVFAHDNVDLFITQQSDFIIQAERPARRDHTTSYPDGQFKIINRADQIIVLRRYDKTLNLKPADGEQNTLGLSAECARRNVHISNLDPTVSRLPLPCRTLEPQQRQLQSFRSNSRMIRHLRREWMRRIDERGKLAPYQKIDQTFNAAETTDTMGDGLRRYGLRATGKREQRLKAPVIGKPSRQRARLAGAAKDQDFGHHVV